jgi:hypothetical protein
VAVPINHPDQGVIAAIGAGAASSVQETPLIEGPVVQIAPVHAKIRRDGYRNQKTAGNGTRSGSTAPSSARPASTSPRRPTSTVSGVVSGDAAG